MQIPPFFYLVIGIVLVVLQYLQVELTTARPWHIVIGSIIVAFAWVLSHNRGENP